MVLLDLLPDFYQNSPSDVEIQMALQAKAQAMREAKEDLFLQLNVETATWGLDAWEAALGIQTDVSKPYTYRRNRILSKLRGQGTTTITMIKNVAESFSNGEVAVTEHNDESRFDISFTGTFGTPPNMDDLTAAVEEIKPAHLAYTYLFVFRTHNELSAYTYGQLAGYTHEILKEGTMD